jgi:hypothetical protein
MYWFKSFSIGQHPMLLILLFLGTGMHIALIAPAIIPFVE